MAIFAASRQPIQRLEDLVGVRAPARIVRLVGPTHDSFRVDEDLRGIRDVASLVGADVANAERVEKRSFRIAQECEIAVQARFQPLR